MSDKPRVVTLCGSTRFREGYEAVNRSLTLEGKIVISVGLFGHAEAMDMAGSVKAGLDELHLRKIDISDGIFVVNPGGYIGPSTRNEIEYARRTGKDVDYLEDPGPIRADVPGTPQAGGTAAPMTTPGTLAGEGKRDAEENTEAEG